MTKLLGMLLCGCACLFLGLGVTGCTKKNKDDKTKVAKETTDKKPSADKTAPTKPPKEAATEKAKLTLKAPADESITQDGTAKVKVSITREHFTDPVDLKLTDLPDGVTADTASIAKDATSAEVTLKASTTAKEAKDHAVKVWATSGTMKQEASFKLTVKKK